MKKIFGLAAVLSAVFALTACGGSTTSTVTEEETELQTEAVAETEAVDNSVYAFQYDASQYVDLGDYKGLTYTITDTGVTKKEVTAKVQAALEAHAEPEHITNRKVKEGDKVNIDFEGLLDGVPFEGGTSNGYTLEIGSHTFIEGFEEGLIGAEIDKMVALNLTFPEDYAVNADLAGKDVVFNVNVNYIEGETIVPEFTNDFVKGLGIEGVETTKAYRQYQKEQIKADKEATAKSNMQQELFEQACANATVKECPQELVDQYVDSYKSYYESYASQFGIELAQLITDYMQITEEQFESDALTYGQEAAGNMMVLAAIAQAEGFEVTDDIYKEKLEEIAAQNSVDSATLETYYGKNYMVQSILNEEVIKMLEENSKAVEASDKNAETKAE